MLKNKTIYYFVGKEGLEPSRALLLNRVSCYSMLPQPNKCFLFKAHLTLLSTFACCSLEQIITILKFLQDMNIHYPHSSKHYHLLAVLFMHTHNFNLGISSIFSTRLSRHCRLYYTYFNATALCCSLKFSTVLSYTLLFSVQHWSKLYTAFTSRISTVLGRFYYGISRHSTQIFIKSVVFTYFTTIPNLSLYYYQLNNRFS